MPEPAAPPTVPQRGKIFSCKHHYRNASSTDCWKRWTGRNISVQALAPQAGDKAGMSGSHLMFGFVRQRSAVLSS